MNQTNFYKKQLRVALRNCGVIDPEQVEEYIAVDGYQALAKELTSMSPEDELDEITKSALRARGGAGFPTHVKLSGAVGKVDTILMPASPRTAFKFGEISDPTQMYLSDLYTISLNICGNGGISVPLGLGEDTQLPVSAQLVGPAFKDRQLLTFARALERGFADAATGAPALSVAPDFAGKGGEL